MVGAVLLLSLSAGATDAFAFLSLGGIFTANMTGNLILIGLVQRPMFMHTLVSAGVSVLLFVAGLFAAFWKTSAARSKPRITSHLVHVLAGTTLLQLTVFLGWVTEHGRTGFGLECVLIGLSAVAMAFQTVLGKKLFGSLGMSTTFVTGTITAVVEDVIDHHRGGRVLRTFSVVLLCAGAFANALVIELAPALGGLLPLLIVTTALGLVLRAEAKTTAPGGSQP
ncbi:hypothetical protein AX769_03840 [Frondihabitans sp. PAMC 28766]|nr:hypothetical protein AX769_03840 [Frondihabitans sp. PAMC 28766]